MSEVIARHCTKLDADSARRGTTNATGDRRIQLLQALGLGIGANFPCRTDIDRRAIDQKRAGGRDRQYAAITMIDGLHVIPRGHRYDEVYPRRSVHGHRLTIHRRSPAWHP